MFDDAQAQVERILSIVQTCPEKFQEKCFEMLLNAYLESKALKPPSVASGSQGTPPAGADLNGGVNAPGNVVPEAIRTRFNSLTTRTKVSGARGAELFDFNVDPFTFHGISVPGASNREKTRNVALLLGLKGYLTSATWGADWKEFRATCLDHSCWDQGNAPTTMKHEWFKTGSAAEDISLSPSGVKAAEALFIKLAGADEGQAA